MIDGAHITALTGILGAAGILTSGCDMEPYQTGARYDLGKAAIVLRPQTIEQVSATVAYCVANCIPLIPQSGNTGLVSGSTPDETGAQAVLSLDRMARRFDLDLDNRSLTVDAGVRLSEVNQRLAAHGLFFPVDLGADPMMGGMLATNTGGSRFLRYGDVRRNTLGATVVLGNSEGTILDLTSGLRKNNTGLDWKQIFIGTSGVFGIITECVLNLEPLPQQVATAYLVPAGSERVMPLLREMEARLGTYLSAFEGMSRNALAAALDHVPSLRNPFPGGAIPDYVILAEVSRSWAPRDGEQSLDMVLQGALGDIWESDASLLADAFIGPPHEMWMLRHALSEGVKHTGKLIAFDLSFRRGDIMTFCDRMRQEMPGRFPDVTICDFGHVGDGGVHFNLVVPRGSVAATDVDFEKQLRDWVFSVAVDDYNGSFSAEHAIGRKNQTYYDLYTDRKFKDLADGLKSLISPGKTGSICFGRSPAHTGALS